jgi:diguanylate cyclase (GGDEF)-like protein
MKKPNRKVKVLYIEDDIGSRILIRKVLDTPSFTLTEASTGLLGLEIATKEKPDLILMDIDLPDIRGSELTTKIKNTKELKDVVVVALTALSEKNGKDMTLVAGCDGYLTKPIDIQKFPQQVLQFVEGKRDLIDTNKEKFYQTQYQKSLVDRLTTKVQELENSNIRLTSISEKLQNYNLYLENVLSILSSLQVSQSPIEFKKVLVNEICDRFKFDRCAFIDVEIENMTMQIQYAKGIEQDKWDKLKYPFNNKFFQKLFLEEQVLLVPKLKSVEDLSIRKHLQKIKADQFIFAYLGTPMSSLDTTDIRQRVLPFLESYMPSLHDREDSDIEHILGNLEEYLTSESLYRAGFIFLDNFQSKRKILPSEFRFIETLIRTCSYMFQNLLLMEQLRYLFIRAEKEAITDPLTDLFNYRYFMQQLNREISRDKRHQSVFSLIMIDIDYFKNYNDNYGHQAGDLILQRIAKQMTKNTRESDIICRYGGEEFTIICPELNKDGAHSMAEKLRQIIQKTNFAHKKKVPNAHLTISAGVASFPDDGDTGYDIIRKADQALYKAKKRGRNKVCIFNSK